MEDEYSVDTEFDLDAHQNRRQRHNRRGIGGEQQREVRNNNDAFTKIKFKIPTFDGKYNPDAYITWRLLLIKSLHVMNFLRTCRTPFVEYLCFMYHSLDR